MIQVDPLRHFISNKLLSLTLLSDPDHFPFPLPTNVGTRTTCSSAFGGAHTRLDGVDQDPRRDGR